VAKGRAIGRFEVGIGLIGILALATTLAITLKWDPRPLLADATSWLDKTMSVSSPATPWRERVTAKPIFAGITTNNMVVFSARGKVMVRDAANGALVWDKEGEWGVPSGDRVLVGVQDGHHNNIGYKAYSSGLDAREIWDGSDARAVWAYEDLVMDLVCGTPDSCQLRTRRLEDGAVLHQIALPGDGRGLTGLNPALPGLRPVADWFEDAEAGAPKPSPDVVGIPFGNTLLVVDLREGQLLRQIDRSDQKSRIVVAGGRVITARAVRDGSVCRYSVESMDPISGETQTRQNLEVGTTLGAGCPQRRDPTGGGDVLIGADDGNHPLIVRVIDLEETMWEGEVGEKVLATDGQLAAVEGLDHRVRVIDLYNGNAVVVAPRETDSDQVAITRCSIFFLGPPRNQLFALGRDGTTVRANVKLLSTIVGYGDNGVVVAAGRTVGVIPLIPACTAVGPPEPGAGEPSAGAPQSPAPQPTHAGK
jgi:hypothetical protein